MGDFIRAALAAGEGQEVTEWPQACERMVNFAIMRRTIITTFIMLAIVAGIGTAREPARPAPAVTQDGITVYFSPNGGATDAIVAEINRATKTIDIQAYSFTSTPIAKALVNAHRRKIAVRVILDKSQQIERYSSATFLNNEGVPTFIDAEHAIAHNKLMIIDGRTIITGSMNFTKAGEESNAENLLVIRDKPKLVAAYAANFAEHLVHSKRYEGPNPPSR